MPHKMCIRDRGKRLMARFRRQGAAGLVSQKRGKQGNHRLPAVYTEHVLDLVREHYADFGPTLAREKLFERHGVLIGRETLRGLMRNAGLWHTRAARRKAVQQPRARRQYFGELIQIDGSEHHWFEDRGSYCTVLTYVDDATSRLQLLRFVEGKSTFDYMQATKLYICLLYTSSLPECPMAFPYRKAGPGPKKPDG